MKRFCAIWIVGFLLMAQALHLFSSAAPGAVGMPPTCCWMRQAFHSVVHAPAPGATATPSDAVAIAGGQLPPRSDASPVLTRDCCRHACCAQAPAPLAQTVPMAPVSPDVPRVLPNVLILTFLWALPPPPVSTIPSTLAFADASQDPAVPLITRHCTLLI